MEKNFGLIPEELCERIFNLAEKHSLKSVRALIKITRHFIWEFHQFGTLPTNRVVEILITMGRVKAKKGEYSGDDPTSVGKSPNMNHL